MKDAHFRRALTWRSGALWHCRTQERPALPALDRERSGRDDRSMAIVTRDEHESALTALARDVADPREGILGPRSVAWQLGGDLAIFLGGGRAALLQLAHPMVAYAVDQHSRA